MPPNPYSDRISISAGTAFKAGFFWFFGFFFASLILAVFVGLIAAVAAGFGFSMLQN